MSINNTINCEKSQVLRYIIEIRSDIMKYYIGADLGTSALKLLLVDNKGEIVNTISKEYPLYFPKLNWSEQNPSDWKNAFVSGVKELLSGYDSSLVEGIGVGGQMHGLVMLDGENKVIRPAILWNDGRTGKQTDYLNSMQKLSDYTANIAFAGFTATKILWVKENEPYNFAKISKIMLPKDYINYILTGVHCTDYSDAAGMLLLDVKNKRWSKEMCEICGIAETQLPKLYESFDVVGNLLPEIAEELGLDSSVKVVAGAGDNAAAAVGVGVNSEGMCNISIGTSGTVFIPCDNFNNLKNNAIHNFCHANGKYHLMGCILSAASCNKWFCDEILNTYDYKGEQANITDEMLGENDIYFLPYLMGERSPINDTNARGSFIGMRLNTTREEMLLAVLEGVAFAIRDNFEEVKKLGISIKATKLCGGGAKSPLWKKVFANVLGIPIIVPEVEEGPAMGSALLAMKGCKNEVDFENFDFEVREIIKPNVDLVTKYNKKYEKYSLLYPALKDIFSKL